MKDEILQLCDENGNPSGTAPRKECHSNPSLIQMIVYLQILNSRGSIFLQKRSKTREAWPERWDTAVGGHVSAGEDPVTALKREAYEELGITIDNPVFLFKHLYKKENETELAFLFRIIYDGPFFIDNQEVAEGKFFTITEIRKLLAKDIFTPNFEYEFNKTFNERS